MYEDSNDMPAPHRSLLQRVDAADKRLSQRCVVAPGEGPRKVFMSIVRRVSQSGSYGVGWVVLFAVVVTAMQDWIVAAVAAGCVLGTLIVNTAVKEIVRRPRPARTAFEDHPNSFSMPSAHTSMAIVGAAIMTVVSPQLWPPWWAWTLMLAVSRIVLGMHYVADVIAGALFGAFIAVVVAVPLIRLVLV